MKQERAGYEPGDRFEGTVERIVAGGAGLVRGPHGVVLVESAAPGDRALFEVTSLRSGAPHGEIATLLDPGPGRAAPPCRWYGRCGGCDLQHLSYATQLEAKRQIVLDALSRIGGISPTGEIEIFAAPQPLGSRTRVELHVDHESGAVGFYQRRSRHVVPIDMCPASSPEINLALQAIRERSDRLPDEINLMAGQNDIRSHPAVATVSSGPMWIGVGDYFYLADPGSFFQSSLDLLPGLIDRAIGHLPNRRLLAWDLYCGVGLFSLPLAKAFHQVFGVDSDSNTIANAGKSAIRNGVDNASFVAKGVAQWIAAPKSETGRPDFVVVDPPRRGLDQSVAERLSARKIPSMTYVSCDPTTLARDLKVLTSGKLRLVDVAIFDLFPQTHHVETVARLAAE